jgi:hypothetical protein
MISIDNHTAPQSPRVAFRGLGIREFVMRVSQWLPPCFYNHIDNPFKSPFGQRGLAKGFRQVPPLAKGVGGGISIRVQVNKSTLLDAPLINAGVAA